MNQILGGRRIVDKPHLLSEVSRLGTHESFFDCAFNNLYLTHEVRKGLWSTLYLKMQHVHEKLSFGT